MEILEVSTPVRAHQRSVERHVDVSAFSRTELTPFGGAHHHDHGLEDEEEDEVT